jgi:hypothetical protein
LIQHATQPAVVYVGHAAALGLLAHNALGSALGADEQDRSAVGNQAADIVHCIVEKRHRLFEVDDMDLAAFAEDEGSHLRVPVTGLVTEVHARLKHLAHGDISHGVFLQFSGLGFHVPHDSNPETSLWRPGTPLHVPAHV